MVFSYCTVNTVQPGQRIVQTRRSIDFDPNDPILKEKVELKDVDAALKTLRKEVCPSFIIIGIFIIMNPFPCFVKGEERYNSELL